MRGKSLDELKKEGVGECVGVVVKTGTREQYLVSNKNAFALVTTSLTHDTLYNIEQNNSLHLAIYAETEDYAGGDDLVARFYIQTEGNGASVFSKVEDVSITTPAVSKGFVGFIEIEDTNDLMAFFTQVSIAGDITVASGGKIKVTLLGKTTAV